MRKIALLFLLASCRHPSALPAVDPPPPPPSEEPPARLAPPPPPATEPAPEWKAPPPVPRLAGDGPRAYVADATGLVEVAAPGGSQVIVPGPITWCNADARGQIVWYLQGGSLFTFDFVDRTAHKVLAGGDEHGPLGIAAPPVIAWGGQQLGGESKVDYAIALQLTMTSPPGIGVSIGCEGDHAWYCYSAPAAPHPALNEQLVAQKQAIEATPILAPAYLAAVAARGAGGSLWSPPPKKPKKPSRRPKVVRSACEADRSTCGQVEAIPGSPLWRVIVGNERGDFYHQSDALWDPATGEYVAVREGKLTRSAEPVTAGELGGLRVSPGGVLSMGGAVFDGKVLHYAPKGDEAITCGWSDGGFRVPGPRD